MISNIFYVQINYKYNGVRGNLRNPRVCNLLRIEALELSTFQPLLSFLYPIYVSLSRFSPCITRLTLGGGGAVNESISHHNSKVGEVMRKNLGLRFEKCIFYRHTCIKISMNFFLISISF